MSSTAFTPSKLKGLARRIGSSKPESSVDATISGGEGERHTFFLQGVRDRIGIFTCKIDVEDGPVQLPIIGEIKPLLDGSCGPDDVAAELREPSLHQHGDQGLVIHDQDTRQAKLLRRRKLAVTLAVR